MTTTTESSTAVASEIRNATEKSVHLWRQGVRTLTGHADEWSPWPQVDLGHAVDEYFEFLQRSVEANREFAAAWVSAVTTLSHVVVKHAEAVEEPGTEQADMIDKAVHEQAETIDQTKRGSRRTASHTTV